MLRMSSGQPSPKPPKTPVISVIGRSFLRLPLKTHVLGPTDDPAQVLLTYAKPQYQPGDVVFISETAVAIMQNRHRDWRTIKPTKLALELSRRVTKSPYGVGLRSPYAMQYAIELCGLPRILLGCLAHMLGRLLKKKRWFYDMAGVQARMMDAEHTMGVQEYYECVIPGPAEPRRTCKRIKQATGMDVAIVDVNDIYPAWCIASTLPRERARQLELSLKDNPLGQGGECTPMGIWRETGAG
jgi:hypothetical protein